LHRAAQRVTLQGGAPNDADDPDDSRTSADQAVYIRDLVTMVAIKGSAA
jgi:hypothetical protein